MPAVVVVGSVNLDHVVQADTLPAPGETVRGSGHTTALGGKGANQARAAARLGASTGLLAQVGPDGDAALDALRADGVDVDGVTRSATPTGTAWITVAGGENTIVVVAGANAHWPDDDAVLAPVRDARVVLMQLEIPVEVVGRAAALATGTVVLNAAPAAGLPDALLARCDVLIVNESELAALTDGDGTPEAAAHALRARGVGTVVATLGAAGALLVDAAGVFRQPAPQVDVVDSTGAGDAFCGAFAAALADGADHATSLRLAVAAGSLAVGVATAQVDFDRTDVLAAAQALPG